MGFCAALHPHTTYVGYDQRDSLLCNFSRSSSLLAEINYQVNCMEIFYRTWTGVFTRSHWLIWIYDVLCNCTCSCVYTTVPGSVSFSFCHTRSGNLEHPVCYEFAPLLLLTHSTEWWLHPFLHNISLMLLHFHWHRPTLPMPDFPRICARYNNLFCFV